MSEIPLTMGKVATVDDADATFLNQWKWHAQKDKGNFYAVRHIWQDGKAKMIRMHRLLLGAPAGIEVDHRDGDGLNNRRQNIRLCTASENHCNARKRMGVTSRYKGVSYHRLSRKWEAFISTNGKNKRLGCFVSEGEAALAYNKAAREYYGEFAKLNLLGGCNAE